VLERLLREEDARKSRTAKSPTRKGDDQ
jgi:hypothetical protein